jgi:hypothetical protein
LSSRHSKIDKSGDFVEMLHLLDNIRIEIHRIGVSTVISQRWISNIEHWHAGELTALRYASFLSASLIGFRYDLNDEAAKVLKTINNQRDSCQQPLPTRQPLEAPHVIIVSRSSGGKLTSNRPLVTANGYPQLIMSLPPATIKIKRKIGEDPVEYFRRSPFSSPAEEILNIHM